MAVPIQSPVPARHALPAVWLARAAIVLFVAALAAAVFPATPVGPSPFGFAAWAAAVVAGFVLSATAAVVVSQEQGHRVVRTGLGYSALGLLAVTAALLAAALTLGEIHDVFLLTGPVAAIAAGALGTLAVFRAEGAQIRFLPATPSGWWASAFLVAFLVVQYIPWANSPWAVLTPAPVMAGPALALAAIVSYRDRSVLSALALVAAPGQLVFWDLAVLISSFTPHP